MPIINCAQCGAEVDSSARFCRLCGQVISPSEAPTLNMEAQTQYGAPTQGFDPAPTYPQWGSPATMQHVAPGTQPIDKRRQNRTVTILIGMIVFLVIAMAGLGAAFFFLRPQAETPQASVPPLPPPSARGAGNSGISSSLIYPGAKVALEVSSPDGNSVLKLQTGDAVDKVVDWYYARLSHPKRVATPVGVTLVTGNTTALITDLGGGTQILITQKAD